ncbi:MAG TPA: SDR family oxidoreductase [Candidatus Omnitrophota bacterium]|nr:SDR family oxidoreductase [Candidatus Omnitrophota bacterium]HPS36967.1 SDR family oxidoreductase [Candidatus Omnitrophota bacterium]
MSGKKTLCLVTGGAGFIGSNLVDGLLARGCRVRVLDNFSTGKAANLKHCRSRIELVRGDLRDEKTLRRAVTGVSYVFHMAAIAAVAQSVDQPVETHDVNVTGIFRLLLESRDAGVKRVIFTSSSAVFGETLKFPTREEDPYKPESPYGASKLMGEYYCQVFSKAYGLETVSLRYFNVYGPRQNPKSRYANVIPIFLKCLLEGVPAEVHWDGKQSRDFVHVADVVAANLLAMKKPGISGESFNIGTHTEIRIIDCLRGLQKILGLKKIRIRYGAKRPGDVRRTFADITKARRLLGYRPSVSFARGLKDTVSWFLRNPERL